MCVPLTIPNEASLYKADGVRIYVVRYHQVWVVACVECTEQRSSAVGKFVFCLTGPYLTGRATIGRLELPPGEGRFVEPPLREAPPRITAYTARGSSD